MKKYILTIILLNVICCFSQKKILPPITKPIISYNILITNNNGKEYYKYNDKKAKYLNGKYQIENYILDKTLSDSTIIDNGLERRTLRYDLAYSKYKRININEQGSFKKGYKNGFWKTIYNNKLVKTENYSNGLAIGSFRVYNMKGNLLYKTTFGLKGNGKYKDFYYKTGILKKEGNYENGKKEGEWCTYNEQGDTKKIVFYEKGNLIKK